MSPMFDWLLGRSRPPHAPVPPAPAPHRDDDLVPLALFMCTTCGRTDLPEAGDWDPPICAECDAAINFDALHEELDLVDD
jgi:hypothetical protein